MRVRTQRGKLAPRVPRQERRKKNLQHQEAERHAAPAQEGIERHRTDSILGDSDTKPDERCDCPASAKRSRAHANRRLLAISPDPNMNAYNCSPREARSRCSPTKQLRPARGRSSPQEAKREPALREKAKYSNASREELAILVPSTLESLATAVALTRARADDRAAPDLIGPCPTDIRHDRRMRLSCSFDWQQQRRRLRSIRGRAASNASRACRRPDSLARSVETNSAAPGAPPPVASQV